MLLTFRNGTKLRINNLVCWSHAIGSNIFIVIQITNQSVFINSIAVVLFLLALIFPADTISAMARKCGGSGKAPSYIHQLRRILTTGERNAARQPRAVPTAHVHQSQMVDAVWRRLVQSEGLVPPRRCRTAAYKFNIFPPANVPACLLSKLKIVKIFNEEALTEEELPLIRYLLRFGKTLEAMGISSQDIDSSLKRRLLC